MYIYIYIYTICICKRDRVDSSKLATITKSIISDDETTGKCRTVL